MLAVRTVKGFGKTADDVSKDRAMKGLREFLRPEFIGRVDEVIVFNKLDADAYSKIASLLISDLVPGLRDKGITLNISDDVPVAVAAIADGGERGARDIRIAIRKNIEDAVANIIIENRNMSIDAINVSVENGKIVCTKA